MIRSSASASSSTARMRGSSLILRDERRQVPLPVEPLELVSPSILETEARRPGELASYRRRRPRRGLRRHHPGRLVHGDASHVCPTSSTSPTWTPMRIWTPCFSAHRCSAAAQCSARAGPSKVASIPSPVVSTSLPPKRSSSCRLASKSSERSSRQRVSPSSAASRRRVDEVREEQRRENPTVDPCREPGPRPHPHPLHLHHGLVADRVAVVPRRDVEHVPRCEHSRVPSMKSTPRLPETTKPTCRAWHHSPPTVGRTCSTSASPAPRRSPPPSDRPARRSAPQCSGTRRPCRASRSSSRTSATG